ncbi:sensor domain-containing diguanylate cyclase [Amycolatopsis sp. CA-230715]|uniref:sensor domain-containing diguanylate cyclase n=1 Tax=Amycolatopsis sp. CA-230715 TaxID=2745196 RepID=UPI0020B26381|nr:GGDEF domain-containing protein [Amycolatopsis sp. CA-230715]
MTERPLPWLGYTLTTMIAMIALVGHATATVAIERSHFVIFGILVAFVVIQTEVSRKIERQRRILSAGPHMNMTSVWTLPAALLLPPQVTAVLVLLVYAYLGRRTWSGIRPGSPHLLLANATNVILSCYGAFAVSHALSGSVSATGTIAAGVAASFLLNGVLTGLGLRLGSSAKPDLKTCAGSWDDNVLELATLCLGGLLVVVLPHEPLLALTVLFPVHMLHRSVLVKHLEELATTDQKTKLLNAVSWKDAAEREMSRAAREHSEFGTLMIDLDFFKKVNDTYGHLAGDDVLKSVAALVKEQTRAHDLAGRFGGEEFVVLLANSSKRDSVATAERIRELVGQLVVHTHTNDGSPVVIDTLTASIGVASFPVDGKTLDEALAAADAAVYAAKRSGRNRVVASPDLDTMTEAPPLQAAA